MNKKFSDYLSLIKYIERFDSTMLENLDIEYEKTLKQYQEYTEMSDERIVKLSAGLKKRIQLLENSIELHDKTSST